MSGLIQPLKHSDTEPKDDAVLQDECDQHYAQHPVVQFIAELLTRLRLKAFPWWSAEQLRGRWSATDRMRWVTQRPDLRQHITTMLTGLAPRAGRSKDPEFQGQLIDSVIDSGDITALEFEDAFHPSVLAAYGPLMEYWRAFRESLPWDEDIPAHQELVAALIDEFLAPRSTLRTVTRRPILTHWEVRTAIPSEIWNARIPLDVRAAIDDARMERERTRPDAPFRAADDLAIATPSVIAAHIPLRVLARVFDVAERSLGFSSGPPASATRVGSTGSTKARAAAAATAVAMPATPTAATPATPAGATPAGGSPAAAATPPAPARAEPEPAAPAKGNGAAPPPPPRGAPEATPKRATAKQEAAAAQGSVPLPGTNGKSAQRNSVEASAPVAAAAASAAGSATDEYEIKLPEI